MHAFLMGFGVLGIYFVVCASCALLFRLFIRIPDEVFRKILHLILLGSLLVWTLVYETWFLAALSAVLFAAAVYPILLLAERIKSYSKVLTERKQGELKNSLLIVFSMFAVVITVCWGWLGDKLLAIASIYAWGLGDAAAALVGKRFGKHALEGRHIEGRKSVEGSLAMFIVSFCSVLTVLLLRGSMTVGACLITALFTALVTAVVELFSMGGMDTITCPFAAMAVILPMVYLFGGLQ